MSDEVVPSAPGAPDDVKPEPPNPDDYSGCCDSGCNPCVFDLYWEAQARYEVALAGWRTRHPEKNT